MTERGGQQTLEWWADESFEVPDSPRIYSLVADRGNDRVLREWLDGHDRYRPARPDSDAESGREPLGGGGGSADAVDDSAEAVDEIDRLAERSFDLCIVDRDGLRRYGDALRARKSEAEPVLLPVLLLTPETDADLIDLDRGSVADNVLSATVDEVVSLPIRQAELEWRISALLRLRQQSLRLHARTEELRLFQQAVESTAHAVYVTDPNGVIQYVNPAFSEITGYAVEEAVGETPEIPESYFEELWETLYAGEVWEEEIVDSGKDGERYHAYQTIAPVTDDGEVEAFVAVQEDITERKEREELLRRRTHAIEEAPIGVSISDPNQKDNPLIYVNEAFCEMTGYDREEATGRNCRFLQGENTDPEKVRRVREAIAAEEPVSVTLRNYRKDGSEFWNHLEVAPVYEDGEVVSFVGFQQNVTDRQQRREQLSVLDRVLRHNLRNDMNVIRGRADMIRATTTGEAASHADRIVDTSDRLLTITEKERAITEVLRESPHTVEIDVADLARTIAERTIEDHPTASVAVDAPESVTATVSTRFEHAVRELVDNAIEHNDRDEPAVLVSVSDDDPVCIAVADDGPQIPDVERSILLGEEDRTSLAHGSGLGLWLVQLIVTRSGGQVSFEPNEPRGNVVRIDLH
jgi:PAS domain S-box-containing protein